MNEIASGENEGDSIRSTTSPTRVSSVCPARGMAGIVQSEPRQKRMRRTAADMESVSRLPSFGPRIVGRSRCSRNATDRPSFVATHAITSACGT